MISLAIIAMVKPHTSTTRIEMEKSIKSLDGLTPEEQMLAWLPPHRYYSSKNITKDPGIAMYSSSNRSLALNDVINIRVESVTHVDNTTTATTGNATSTQRIGEEQQDDSTSFQILPHHAEPVLLDWTAVSV